MHESENGSHYSSSNSWGTELWDKYDSVTDYTKRGIDFIDRWQSFMRDRSKVELEYAKSLKKLVDQYQPKKKDFKEDWEYSFNKGFLKLGNELCSLANQHESIAEFLNDEICNRLTNISRELHSDRKKCIADGDKVMGHMNQHIILYERAKKTYEKAIRDSDKASESYLRADANMHLSRAEVYKALQIKDQKQRELNDQKQQYASCLKQVNEEQRFYYQEAMPKVFESFQNLDRRRIEEMRQCLLDGVETELKLQPIISRCLEGAKEGAEAISVEEDFQLVIEHYKTGYLPPSDFQINESTLSNGDSGVSENTDSGSSGIAHSTGTPSRSPSFAGTTNGGSHGGSLRLNSISFGGTERVGGKKKKKSNIFSMFGSKGHSNSSNTDDENYSELPPTQRRKKLEKRLQELTHRYQKETDARDGLTKMKAVYEQNRTLGDPASIQGQLSENEEALSKLRSDINKFRSWIDEVDMSVSTGGTMMRYFDAKPRRESDSISVRTDEPADVYEAAPGEIYAELPLLGSAIALYSFKASSEGTISMKENEEFDVMEKDEGDGWTRVKRKNAANAFPNDTVLDDEGFVPTGYLNIKFIPPKGSK